MSFKRIKREFFLCWLADFVEVPLEWLLNNETYPRPIWSHNALKTLTNKIAVRTSLVSIIFLKPFEILSVPTCWFSDKLSWVRLSVTKLHESKYI